MSVLFARHVLHCIHIPRLAWLGRHVDTLLWERLFNCMSRIRDIVKRADVVQPYRLASAVETNVSDESAAMFCHS